MFAPRTVPELAFALVAGVIAGALGSYAQQYVVGGVRLPAGVALGLLLLAATTLVVHLGLHSRLGCTAVAVGWFAVVTMASSRRREGDVLVPGDARGWSFLLGGTAVLGLAIALQLRRPAVAR